MRPTAAKRTVPALGLLGAGALGLLGAGPPPPFRIGIVGPSSAPCAAPAASVPAGERAYFDLLARRLDRAVLACPVASYAEGAQALAAGRLDMTAIDAASYPPVRGAVRAAMTVHADGTPVRVPVVLAVKAGQDGGPATLKGRTVAFGGASAVALALPRQVLAEQGYGAPHELLAPNEAAAMAALRAGKADAVALQAAAWQRQCQAPSPKVRPCADLKLVWLARPQAQRAFAVRRDLPETLRFRLLGVHVAMNLEDRPAFAWAASQLAPAGGADFQPAEPLALEVARLP
ncbi:PhnD/SsuA/transferrin family substrate-binding protein [Caulobacter sp. KR2-114]|uniref:PhnD/SsuA/transferrin family substrate-binding protein n=1 Tax=Caulobacter sp. KR2-114 TaxID=3400912 RepID=UPI003C0DD3E5